MKRIIKKKTAYRIAAVTLLTGMLMSETMPLVSYAAGAKVDVDETMYLNLDYYGQISKANVVKGITFNSSKSYTDHGNYTALTNMSTSEQLEDNNGSVTVKAPENGGKLYFQGTLDPKKVVVPWTFDVTYKVNGVVTDADHVGGAKGLIEMDIDAIPNEKASEYMKNNFILMVGIPVDSEKYYSVDAPDSQVANMGEYSCVVFEALPGKEGHFVARFGTDSFETVGAIIMMSPATVGDLKDVKDLKELKDKFRDNTNAMFDDVEAIMDNVTNVSEQLSLTNQMLQNLQEGKNKIHSQKDAIFNGNDVAIQDLRDLSGTLTPLDSSLKTTQWLVYDVNKNLNTLDQDLLDTSSKMKSLSNRLKNLGTSMSDVDAITEDELKNELGGITTGLNKVTSGIKNSTQAGANIGSITANSSKDIDDLITNAGITEAADGYLPSAVIGFLNNCVNAGMVDMNADFGDANVVEQLEKMLIAAQFLNDNLTTLVPSFEAPVTSKKLTLGFNGMVETKVKTENKTKEVAIEEVIEEGVTGAKTVGKYSDYKKNADDFIESVAAVKDLKDKADDISKNTASDGTNVAANLKTLTDGLQDISDGIDDIDDPAVVMSLMGQIAAVSADIEEISNYGGAVAFQTARFINSARNLAGDMDTLIATMNNYYQDVQDAIENTDNVLLQIQKTTDDVAGTLQTVNDTIRSAEENLSNAADEGLEAGRQAVDNTGKIVENVKDLKASGADLRKSINDELDEKEAENNFLNMDPYAVKESLTSNKNPEPSSVSIICRTDEISADDEEAQKVLDAEEAEAQSSVWERIINVFKKIWYAITGIFSKD